MPHPERAYDDLLGSADGAVLLRSVLEASGGASHRPGTAAEVPTLGPAGSRPA
jgi:hypothetical protein